MTERLTETGRPAWPGRTTFAATGDSFVTRRLPAQDDAFRQVAERIRSADVRFTNLEVTVHEGEGVPGAVSGGTWAMGAPGVLDDLQAYGFNLIAWANNHTLDYLYEGLEATSRHLRQRGLVNAGVGRNLAEASAPQYLETPSGRVALIAATSTFHETWAAGEQRPDMPGRPGVNPLRYIKTFVVSRERLEQLKGIARATGINADRELMLKEGFAVADDDGIFQFGAHRFRAGDVEGEETVPHPGDVRRIVRSIRDAARQADYVLVSIHAHEMKNGDKEQAAQFLEQFARTCIDEGAHAVIGHGPHIVRAIEIYKGRPIFYSLGNFIFQNDTVTALPADFYTKYGLGHEHTVADALDKRSHNDTRGLGANPKVWSSVVASWTMENGELTDISLHPVSLGFGTPRYRRGWPVVTDDVTVLKTLQTLSEPYGTTIEIKDNIGKVVL